MGFTKLNRDLEYDTEKFKFFTNKDFNTSKISKKNF